MIRIPIPDQNWPTVILPEKSKRRRKIFFFLYISSPQNNKNRLLYHWYKRRQWPRFHSHLLLDIQLPLPDARSRFSSARACSRWPRLSDGLQALLFPIIADRIYFTITGPRLSRRNNAPGVIAVEKPIRRGRCPHWPLAKCLVFPKYSKSAICITGRCRHRPLRTRNSDFWGEYTERPGR